MRVWHLLTITNVSIPMNKHVTKRKKTKIIMNGKKKESKLKRKCQEIPEKAGLLISPRWQSATISTRINNSLSQSLRVTSEFIKILVRFNIQQAFKTMNVGSRTIEKRNFVHIEVENKLQIVDYKASSFSSASLIWLRLCPAVCQSKIVAFIFELKCLVVVVDIKTETTNRPVMTEIMEVVLTETKMNGTLLLTESERWVDSFY